MQAEAPAVAPPAPPAPVAPGPEAAAAPQPAPAAAPETAPETPASPVPDTAAIAEIARLTAAVADREAAVAALQAQLTDQQAALQQRDATLAEREAALAQVTADLAARDDELNRLRGEVTALRDRYAFDLQLAAVKSGAAPLPRSGAAPVAPEAIDAMLETAKGPTDAPMTEIQFDSGSARLSPGGQAHCAAAAVMLADMKLARIRLIGYTDRVGGPARNHALAEHRARAVADFLISAGVTPDMIEWTGMTEADLLPIATGDGVPEPLNRSVSIIAVPPPTT